MSQLRRFNPYGLPDSLVEAIATGRDRLVGRILDEIEANLTSRPRQHLLVRAPRGAGKSFLMRLVQIALRRKVEAAAWPVLAVLLPEEQRNVRRPHSFLAEIRRLVEGRPAEELRVRWSEDQAAWDTELAALDAAIGERLLIVMVENFDHLLGTAFKGEQAQAVLRHTLARDDGRIMLLATSTQRVAPDYDDPLFRGFTELRLEPWSEDECMEFFAAARAATGKPPLTQAQQSRARAIAVFAGGSPRIATVLHDALDSGDAVGAAEILDALVDEMSDYYRNRLDGLSPRAQDVFDTLLRLGEPKSQSEVARAMGEAQNRVAEVFSELLADQMLVGQRAAQGRETLYRATDRLMVHFYRTRYFDPEQRASRLEAIADFLASFFDAEELGQEAVKLEAQGRERDGAVLRGLSARGAGASPATEAAAPADPGLGGLAETAFRLSLARDHPAAIATLREALARAEAVGDVREQARSLRRLGWNQGEMGEHAAAVATLREALARAEAAGDVGAQAESLHLLGWNQGQMGEHAAAVETLREALARAEAAGDVREQAGSLRHLGWNQGEMGEHAAAVASLREALARAEAAGDVGEQARSLRLLGWNQGEMGEHAAAVASLREALARAEAAGDVGEQARSLRLLGWNQGQMGEHAAAVASLREALARAEAAGDVGEQARSLRLLGWNQGEMGEHAAAVASLREALARAEAAGDVGEQARSLRLLGWNQGEMGEHAAAVASLREALARAEAAGDVREQERSLSGLGVMLRRAHRGHATDLPALGAAAHALLSRARAGGAPAETLAAFADDIAALLLRENAWAEARFLHHAAAWEPHIGQMAPAMAEEAARLERTRAFARVAEALSVLETAKGPPQALAEAFTAALAAAVTDAALLRDLAAMLAARHPRLAQRFAALFEARATDLEHPGDPAALERFDPDIVTAIRRLRGVRAAEEAPAAAPRRRARSRKKRE